MKPIFCMAIVLSSVLIGQHYTTKMNSRIGVLNRYITLLEECAIRLKYENSNLAELFSDNFADYQFNSTEEFYVQWTDFVNTFSDQLNREDIAVLTEFALELGGSDAQSQLKHISLYRELLKKRLSQAEQEREKKHRLYRVLPASLGVVIAILLI